MIRSRFVLYTVIACAFLVFDRASAELPKPEVIAKAIQLPVEKYKLENGLVVLLLEDHSAPFFTYHQWFRVGSRDEKVGRTGLAHFFEHLMFKGTPQFPKGDFDRVLRANGGINNAFTTHDYTGYFESLPSGKLELAIKFESDRMRNLMFDLNEINSEREVVKEERRMRVENDVGGLIEEKMWSTLYKIHSYHWPVIGYMNDLNAASIDDMKEFYRVHYAPNNAVLVVVGDFDSSEAKKLIQNYYGKIASQDLPKRDIPAEPDQAGERRATILKPVQSVTVAAAYKTVRSGDADQYPLDILATIMGGGASSRLHRRLVYKEQVASEVSVSSYTPGEPGMFRITVAMKPGQSADPTLKKLSAEIEAVKDKPVDDRELEKAKAAVMKDYVQALKTISGKAHALALNEIYFNDYRQMFRDLESYLAVNAEQIRQVAKKYLKPTARTVVVVRPGAANEKTSGGKGVEQ